LAEMNSVAVTLNFLTEADKYRVRVSNVIVVCTVAGFFFYIIKGSISEIV